MILREVCRLRLGVGGAVRGLSSQGKDWTLPFLPPIASAAPSHLSRHPPPSPHLSQSKDWKIDASVYEAHNVASKTRTQQSSLAPLMGYYLCHFPPGAGAITAQDGAPSPSTPPAIFQCHAEGCVLQSSWLDLGAGELGGDGRAAPALCQLEVSGPTSANGI